MQENVVVRIYSLLVLHSMKASGGGVCLVKVMSAPTNRHATKPMVDAHAPDASLWVRLNRIELEPSRAYGWMGISVEHVSSTGELLI